MSSRKFQRRTKAILDSLNADMGTAFDAANPATNVYVENLAVARAIAAAWGTNERLSYLWQPMRCSMDILARWEKIMVLPVGPNDTDYERRLRVAKLFDRWGKASTHARLTYVLQRDVGPAFVSIDHIGFTYANITVPDGSWPYGTPDALRPWSSQIAQLLIRMQHPPGYTGAQFYEAVGKVYTVLDPLVPAWAGIDWYGNGDVFIDMPDGPSAVGFFLDQPNLNEAIFGYEAPIPAPTVVSLNYSQVDVAGGGADVVLTGTNLAGATALEVGTGGVWTPASITGTATGSVSFQAPPMAANTYDVRVTAPGGQATLVAALEYWAPNTESGCTEFCEEPNYAVVSGTGTWAARVGTALTQAATPPAASGGAPVFAANGYLDGAALNTLITTTAGTIFVVANPTNAGAVSETVAPYNNPQIVTNATQGTLGLAFGNLGGTPGFVFHFYDGATYRGKHAPAAAGTYHAVVARFTSAALSINVDGGAFASAAPAPTGAWSTTVGAIRLGAQYNATQVLQSTIRAVVVYNKSITDAIATKLYKWAQQRHGVA